MSSVIELMTNGQSTGVRRPDVDVAISVVVPVAERPEALDALYREYAAPLKRSGVGFEFIFAAEPWAENALEPLAKLVDDGEPIRILRLGQTVGEASLLRASAAKAGGSVIVTLPAYYRVAADVIPELTRRLEHGVDLVVARRSPRRDSWINRLQNRVFHTLLRLTVGGNFRDVACGVRAMRREVLDNVPLYGDFFRFLPVLALREGYRVEEIPAPQHDRDTRTRVYGPGVYLRRAIDVLGLFFLVRFTYKPLRFFGLVGAILTLGGLGVLGVLLIQRLGGQGIANRPLLLLANLAVVLGIQAFALGLIGEIIVHFHARSGKPYRIRSDDHP